MKTNISDDGRMNNINIINNNNDNSDFDGISSSPIIGSSRTEVAKRLLQAGADPETPDANGLTARDNLTVDFGTAQFIAQMYGQTLEQESLAAGRAEIAQLLGEDSGATRQAVEPANADLIVHTWKWRLR